jgi:nitrous oxide reductase accessory protein NosL
MTKWFLMLFLLASIGAPNSIFAQPKEIEANKTCPLCGMYPARYPRFHCRIAFEDGSYEAFDSAVGLLVYVLFPENTGIKVKRIAGTYFKDYLKETWLEADKAFFVVGSEIMGPMGIEFLPVDSEQAAEELKEQEKGQEIIPFKEIDRQYMVKAAKAGWLHFLAKNLVLK